MFERPLWQQLLILWLGAVSLAAVLLWFDLRPPFRFLWLIPYPTLRTIAPSVARFFRMRPLFATAVLGIPLAALFASLALIAMRALPLLRRAATNG